MNNQPDQSVDYLRDHPNAVVDPAKAEVMASASGGQEEAVVVARGLAQEAASHLGDPNYNNGGYLGATKEARSQTDLAEEARNKANEQASAAGEIYDRVKAL